MPQLSFQMNAAAAAVLYSIWNCDEKCNCDIDEDFLVSYHMTCMRRKMEAACLTKVGWRRFLHLSINESFVTKVNVISRCLLDVFLTSAV